MSKKVNLAKKYQKFKEDVLSVLKSESEFEGYGFNYILTGRFFDLLNELEKNGFNVGNKKIEIGDTEDCDNLCFMFDIYSDVPKDELKVLIIYVGYSCSQTFQDGYETNDPMPEFCYVDLYGWNEYDIVLDKHYLLNREDIPKLSEWLDSSLKSNSPKQVVSDFEDIFKDNKSLC